MLPKNPKTEKHSTTKTIVEVYPGQYSLGYIGCSRVTNRKPFHLHYLSAKNIDLTNELRFARDIYVGIIDVIPTEKVKAKILKLIKAEHPDSNPRFIEVSVSHSYKVISK